MTTPIARGLLGSLIAASLVMLSLVAVGSAPAYSQAASGVTVPGSARLSGVDLQTYNDPSLNPNFAQIKADGANMVNVTVWWVVPSMSSDSIAPDYSGPTILDARLEQFIQEAEAAGLQASITPDFVVDTSSGTQWRGGYDPGNTTNGDKAFFANYTSMVDHYASIAEQYQLPMYWVGSEMLNSEPYTADWKALISSVRQTYSGRLLYDVNWNPLGKVQFYGSLDAMSVSAYWPLSDEADPSLDVLLNGWKQGLAQLQNEEQVWKLPVYFGEVGYDSSTYAAAQPYGETYVSADPQLQYRCYEALDETFSSQPWWGGVLWWAWDGGVYNMDGEPAESLIGVSSVGYPPVGSRPTGSTPSTTPLSKGKQGVRAGATSSASAVAANALPGPQALGLAPADETVPGRPALRAESGGSTTSIAGSSPGVGNTETVRQSHAVSHRGNSKLKTAGSTALVLLLTDLALLTRALRHSPSRRVRKRRLAKAPGEQVTRVSERWTAKEAISPLSPSDVGNLS